MPPSCVFDWNQFGQYGISGLILAGIGLLLWFKVWPSFDKFLGRLNTSLETIADSLSKLLPAMQNHEANTAEVLKKLQDLAETNGDRRKTTRRKPQ